MLKRINLSAAIIVLICFFLPWEQVSCGGARDTLSGFELARDMHAILWLVPVLMGLVIALGVTQRQRAASLSIPIVNLICGAIATALMNRERLRVNDEGGVISAQLTGWFWLGFLAALAVAISAIGMLWRRRRPGKGNRSQI